MLESESGVRALHSNLVWSWAVHWDTHLGLGFNRPKVDRGVLWWMIQRFFGRAGGSEVEDWIETVVLEFRLFLLCLLLFRLHLTKRE